MAKKSVSVGVLAAYPLRDIPLDVWTAARQRAETDGISVRAAIVGMLRAYAEGRISIRLDVSERRPSRGPRVKVPA